MHQSVQDICTTAAACIAKQTTYVDLQRRAEHDALRAENERLRAHNAALSQLVAQQATAATQWQSEFLASISASVGAFSASQDRLLKTGVEAIQSTLRHEQDDRVAKTKSKQANLALLEQEALAASQTLNTAADTITSLVAERKAVRSIIFWEVIDIES